MRKPWISLCAPALLKTQLSLVPRAGIPAGFPYQAHARYLANIRETNEVGVKFPQVWFNSTAPKGQAPNESGGSVGQGSDVQPPSARTLKLGKTIRILHERLPTLLASPLPQEILSPQIKLHLFPSTHPHLPSVGGKIAYNAALWTAPVAWGRVPVVGNVRLDILSERMMRNGVSSCASAGSERLVVRWKTCGKTKGKGVGALYRGISGRELSQVDKITEFLGGYGDEKSDESEFCGLFLFEFDGEGRIVAHTIEHVEEGGNWEKMTKVVSVTDWLLGKAWGKKREEVEGLALGYCDTEMRKQRRRRMMREP